MRKRRTGRSGGLVTVGVGAEVTKLGGGGAAAAMLTKKLLDLFKPTVVVVVRAE